MKKTSILQCPGMVCSPPVMSKCLGEAHRRLGVIYITLDYIRLHYITLNPFVFRCVYCTGTGIELQLPEVPATVL